MCPFCPDCWGSWPRCEVDTSWIYGSQNCNYQPKEIRGTLSTGRMQVTCWCAVFLLTPALCLVSTFPSAVCSSCRSNRKPWMLLFCHNERLEAVRPGPVPNTFPLRLNWRSCLQLIDWQRMQNGTCVKDELKLTLCTLELPNADSHGPCVPLLRTEMLCVKCTYFILWENQDFGQVKSQCQLGFLIYTSLLQALFHARLK